MTSAGCPSQCSTVSTGTTMALARIVSADSKDQSALESATHPNLVSRADGLGDDRVERHHHPHPENDRSEKIQIAQSHRRQRDAREMANNNDIDHAHPHDSDLHESHWSREPECPAQVVATGNKGTQIHWIHDRKPLNAAARPCFASVFSR